MSSVRPVPQESWRPQHLAQVDALASSMMSMELGQVKDWIKTTLMAHIKYELLNRKKNFAKTTPGNKFSL